uniref:BED-type domain-containing protein n=1 Tax=Anopheles dirus TaxID=7168 RepID=A0A182NWQ9_9DIPT
MANSQNHHSKRTVPNSALPAEIVCEIKQEPEDGDNFLVEIENPNLEFIKMENLPLTAESNSDTEGQFRDDVQSGATSSNFQSDGLCFTIEHIAEEDSQEPRQTDGEKMNVDEDESQDETNSTRQQRKSASSYESTKGEILKHFEMKGANKAKCRHCQFELSYLLGKSTTNLKRHLVRKHSSALMLKSNHQTVSNCLQSNHQTVSKNATASPPMPHGIPIASATSDVSKVASVMRPAQPAGSFLPWALPEARKRDLDAQLILFICRGYHPFSTVNEEGFQSFLKSLNPSYEIPNTDIILNHMLPTMYHTALGNVRDKVGAAKGVALTIDNWTGINNVSFISATSHFVDDNAIPRSYLLECFKLPDSYTDEIIHTWLKKVMIKFGIANKITAIVSNNATSMELVASMLTVIHIPCFAKCFNLLLQHAIKDSIKSTVTSVNKMITIFIHNSEAQQKFKELQANLKCLKLKLDSETSWNSIYEMLETFLKNKQPLMFCFSALTIQSELQEKDWLIIEQAVDVLELFSSATKDMSSSNPLTLSKAVILSQLLMTHMSKRLQHPTLVNEVKNLISALMKGINDKLKPITGTELARKAVLLDPRYKEKGFMDDDTGFRHTYEQVLLDLSSMYQGNSTELETEYCPELVEGRHVPDDRLWADYDSTVRGKRMYATPKSKAARELDNYIKEDCLDRRGCPFSWWKTRQLYYPHLYQLMIHILSIPASSIPCEQIFTKTGQLHTEKRNILSPMNIEEVMFVSQNYRK